MKTVGKYRWIVVILLFFATTINYLDRQVIGLLKDNLAKDFNWSEKDYSKIVMAFSTAYAIGLLGFGRLIDRIGTKLGYAFSIIIWSVAAMAHALAKSTFGFGVARTALGVGEAGNFPAAIKTIAEWFPKKDRALATGIFNSGTNISAIAGPPLIAWIFISYGWQQAFLLTGMLGFIWLIFWLWLYEIPMKQKRLSKAEFDYVHSDNSINENIINTKVSWKKLLSVKETWAFATGKFLTDPIWYFYLFWIPSYFNTTFSLDLKSSAVYVSTVYVAASFGSILGGYLSSRMIKKGWPVYKARKRSMLIFACCVAPIILVRFIDHVWPAVAVISVAAAAHQAWSATIFTTVSDIFPKAAVGSVIGIGSMAGSVGGILFPFFIGIVLDHFKLLGVMSMGYNIIFAICGSAYLLAWLAIHFLTPQMEELKLIESEI
jgi:MFS transporter, ACS family, hexuronate transporter